MKAIDITGSKLFPIHVRIFGGILILIGIYMINSRSEYFIGSGLIIAGLFILTSREGTIVDTSRKFIKPYYWIFGLKFGKINSYDELDRILVKKYRGKMEMGTVVQRTQTSATSYDAWLQTKEGKEYYLFDKNDQTAIYIKLAKYTADLGIKVYDPNA